ncbi:hypothetical protein ACET3Z_023351 [Daucus carota]
MFMFFNLALLISAAGTNNENERKPYIVYMGELPERSGRKTMEDDHHDILSDAIGDERIARESKIYSYRRSFNGFAARLLPHEATYLSKKEGVVSVFPNTIQKLQTTRSWDFLGLSDEIGKTKRNLKVESNLIIGVLDTGIYVESPSFNDIGFGPPPPKWKGKCAQAANFTGCNNKVIGAQYFNLAGSPIDLLTPVDVEGHGTHTASTAAGNSVRGANLYGLAKGTARGAVPSARVAAYKVCWSMGCQDMDMLAAFDAAIADGVDVISVSIGGPSRIYFEDSMAIGAFHAMKKGIMTVCAAGNYGPDTATVQNVAPWMFTAGATSMDRQFETDVTLGNGMRAKGISINTFSSKKHMFSLTSGTLAANSSSGGASYRNASACEEESLSKKQVKGKIVYCLGSNGQDSTISENRGAGIIMSGDDNYSDEVAFSFLIPATVVNQKDGKKIEKYINSTRVAKGTIHKSRTTNMTNAPSIASFSSRGPQSISMNILKPDIAAPGLSILAAYSPLVTLTGDSTDNRFTLYNIISGTSMSTPHVAGAIAYVKSFHPAWSPSAIKSALMTTATPMKVKPMEAELATGAGQINPTKALDPGLIYEMNPGSYIRFLCKEGYNNTMIRIITGGKHLHDCSTLRARGFDGLNYPSMHIQLSQNSTKFSASFFRSVTNVGSGKSEYEAKVMPPPGVSVNVEPKKLVFERPHQKRAFKVVVKGKFGEDENQVLSGSLEWRDSSHSVRSPILICKSLYQP